MPNFLVVVSTWVGNRAVFNASAFSRSASFSRLNQAVSTPLGSSQVKYLRAHSRCCSTNCTITLTRIGGSAYSFSGLPLAGSLLKHGFIELSDNGTELTGVEKEFDEPEFSPT